MTNAIDFNWFYHNNCKEFQGIKRMIWECNNPTEKQLLKWREEHRMKFMHRMAFFFIANLGETHRNPTRHPDIPEDFAEFAFDIMYQTGAGAPWLKG